MNKEHKRRQSINHRPAVEDPTQPRPINVTPKWRQFKTHKVIIQKTCDTFQSITQFWKCWGDEVKGCIVIVLLIAWCIGAYNQSVRNAKQEHMRQEIKDGLNAYYGTDIKLTPQEEAILNNVAKDVTK